MNYQIFNKFPILDIDEKYILREQSVDDYKEFFDYYADPRVSQYILSSVPRNLEEAKLEIKYWVDLYKNRSAVYWAIARKSDDKMIGAIGFNDWNLNNNRAEISYDLAYDYWGQNIMTNAMEKVLDYGFNVMGINRIQASTLKENIASQKVLQKFGFELEGILRKYRRHNDLYYDIMMYSLLNKFVPDKYSNNHR